MRFLLPLLLSAAALPAAESDDRAAIASVLAAVADPLHSERLFTADADPEERSIRLIDLHIRRNAALPVMVGTNEPWREMTIPRVVAERIRFLTPDVALVDAVSTIAGAVTLRQRVPLIFVLKREGNDWRISALRAASAVPKN